MKHRRVRVGAVYRYDPVPLDRIHPPAGGPAPGDLLQVFNPPGCPPANTMGHAFVRFADGLRFAGLVCTNSLQPRGRK